MFNARFQSLPYMAARVKIVEISGRIFHAEQIVRHGAEGEISHGSVGRAGVERVGRVRENAADSVLFRETVKFFNIRGLISFAAPPRGFRVKN